jgi:hypothetical protein
MYADCRRLKLPTVLGELSPQRVIGQLHAPSRQQDDQVAIRA